jgi:hypothetical protein
MDDTQMDPIVDAVEETDEVEGEEAAMIDEEDMADEAGELDEEVA